MVCRKKNIKMNRLGLWTSRSVDGYAFISRRKKKKEIKMKMQTNERINILECRSVDELTYKAFVLTAK